jgi:uncharacterized membrane protein YvbJ
MPRPFEDDRYCPNCGQFTEGEPVCPNCGAILDKTGDNSDELDGFHEDEGEDINDIDIEDDEI